MNARSLLASPALWLSLAALAACGGASESAPPPEAPTLEPTPAADPLPPKPKLSIAVLTGSPEGFLVTSTLVSGDKEAVLIDAQFTLADGKAVAEKIKTSNKELTTVYVTHFHPDHYFGFSALKEVFPDAKLVALPATVAAIEKTWADKVKTWKPLYKDGIVDKPIVPEALTSPTIVLEGEKLELVGGVPGDAPDNSYVWIPSLKTVVAGDVVYDAVFPWTAETTPETRQAWGRALDAIIALAPERVVPGHQKPEQHQDPANLAFTKDYLVAYDKALGASKTPEELQAKLKAQYPDAGLEISLKLGSEASIKPSRKTARK